ncbi:MAG: hypothetical protein PHH85_08995 [Candidatus Methanoperedens sp.]|nr:hypothetical protein [Candidatus Methanoperedens sp.]
MAETLCQQELSTLQKMAASLENIYLYLTGQTSTPSFQGNQDGWTYTHVGKSWFFNKVITYDGNANTQDLNIPRSFQLNRIEQIWNDATAKDFSIRVFSDPANIAYIELDTQTANIATSRLVQAGIEYKFPGGSRLRIYSGANIAGKTDTIKIQVDEL